MCELAGVPGGWLLRLIPVHPLRPGHVGRDTGPPWAPRARDRSGARPLGAIAGIGPRRCCRLWWSALLLVSLDTISRGRERGPLRNSLRQGERQDLVHPVPLAGDVQPADQRLQRRGVVVLAGVGVLGGVWWALRARRTGGPFRLGQRVLHPRKRLALGIGAHQRYGLAVRGLHLAAPGDQVVVRVLDRTACPPGRPAPAIRGACRVQS